MSPETSVQSETLGEPSTGLKAERVQLTIHQPPASLKAERVQIEVEVTGTTVITRIVAPLEGFEPAGGETSGGTTDSG